MYQMAFFGKIDINAVKNPHIQYHAISQNWMKVQIKCFFTHFFHFWEKNWCLTLKKLNF